MRSKRRGRNWRGAPAVPNFPAVVYSMMKPEMTKKMSTPIPKLMKVMQGATSPLFAAMKCESCSACPTSTSPAASAQQLDREQEVRVWHGKGPA